MSACEKRQEWQLAVGLLSRMAKAKVVADTICHGAAISACEKSHEWQLALDLLSRMAEAKVNAETICYSAAISACEKRQEWQLALDLLSRMAPPNCVLILTMVSTVTVDVIHPSNKEISENGALSDCELSERACRSFMATNLSFLTTILAGDGWETVAVP